MKPLEGIKVIELAEYVAVPGAPGFWRTGGQPYTRLRGPREIPADTWSVFQND